MRTSRITLNPQTIGCLIGREIYLIAMDKDQEFLVIGLDDGSALSISITEDEAQTPTFLVELCEDPPNDQR